MKQITLYYKPGLTTLAATIIPASSRQNLVKDDTRLATALAELISIDGCLVA